MFRQDVVTAKDPIGQQNVIGFMVPGVVGEIALGDELNVPATFGENPIGRSGTQRGCQLHPRLNGKNQYPDTLLAIHAQLSTDQLTCSYIGFSGF